MTTSTSRDRSTDSPRASRRAREQHRRQVRRRNRTLLAVGGGLIVVVAGAAAISIATQSNASDAAEPGGLAVELGDFFIRGDLTVPAGEVRLDAVNVGAARHDVGLRGGRISGELATGESTQLDLGVLAPGDYTLYCDIPGHVEAGMVAQLHVTEPVATTTAT